MHVGNLPPEVLATILKLICEERHYRINKWISRMGILAVCRQWRLLALPMVYKKVSIDNIDKVRTNMDLMTDTMAHYPRALNIWVSCDDGNSVRRLQDVVEKLHAKKSMLHRVFNLHLHVDFTALPTDGDSDDDNDDSEVSLVETEKLQEVACSLKTLFPKISTLHCHINIAEAAGLVFETALLKQYVSQLVKVEVNSLALTPEMCFTDTISDLSVWWYPDSGSIPSINTNRMTKLELAGIDEAFDWSTFAPKDSTESNVLYFPVLQHIFVDVWYMPEDADNDDEESEGTLVVPRNAFSNVLNAPRLRVLKLRLCPFTCSFIASIAAPKVFKILEIFTLSDLRFEFFGFRLSEAAKKLFTKYYDEHSTHGMIDDMKFVNELQSTKELEYHSLSVHIDGPIDEIIHRINWPRVTRLFISTPISLCNVLLLIGSLLPNLASLKVENIIVEEQDDGSLVIPELCDSSLATPIECNLKTLEFGFDTSRDCVKDLSEDFSRFMIQTVKSLQCVAFSNSKR